MPRLDFSDIRGLDASTLVEIRRVVARREPVLLVGPPGAGATMIAPRIATILPERSKLASATGVLGGRRRGDPSHPPGSG